MGDAWASCEPGYYTMCFRDPDNYDNCTDCSCEPCPVGQTSNGLGTVYEDACHMSSNSGCYDMPVDLCPGYDNCPSGIGGNGKKCKSVSGYPNGCAQYEICDTSTGNITNYVSGECHLEGETCYSDIRACKEFDIDMAFGNWSCSKTSQTGNAHWYPPENAWSTNRCECKVTDKNINMDNANTTIKCAKANAEYIVLEENRYKTKTVNDSVFYTSLRRYCSECYPGYLPTIVSSPDSYGVYTRPSGNGNWGAYACATMVSAPHYADGCDINFALQSSNAAINECKKQCDISLTIITNGATSDAACVPDGLQEYSDDTGTFTLGTDKCQ